MKGLGGGLGGLAAGLGLPVACAPTPETSVTRVPLEDIPDEGALRVLDGENPVELRRVADGNVVGRSLWCTHSGCEVRWEEDRGVYLCPCHDGVYDAAGRPVSGPPPRALSAVPLRIRDGEVLIGLAPEVGS